jgi:hypothetical protein
MTTGNTPSPSPEAAPPSAGDLTQVVDAWLAFNAKEEIAPIRVDYVQHIRVAAHRAGERAGREQAAQWHQSRINQLEHAASNFQGPTVDNYRKWIEGHEKAIAAIRALAPDPKP